MIGVRNDFTKPAPAPLTADVARARVAQLVTDKAKTDAALKRAVAANDGQVDLNELSRKAHRLANDLTAAEEELASAEAVELATATQRKKERFAEVAKELLTAREQFGDLYKAASLSLGRWYALRQEARELANEVANKMGNGTTYYAPHIQEVLADASAPPNPLPALRDSGLQEIQVALHERTISQLVPLQEKKR
jgi:hypothetical protein